MRRRSLPIVNQKRAPSRRKQALEIHTTDLELQPLERYVELQRSIGRLWAIKNVDVDVDQLAYQGGTFPSPLARQSRASLPPPRVTRARFQIAS